MLTTFAGEEIISSSDNGVVTLTTHRVSLERKEFGRSYYIAIFLEDISSVQTHYRSWVVALYLAVACLALGLFTLFSDNTGDKSTTQIFFISAVVLFIGWFFSKQKTVFIYPNGGKPLAFLASNMTAESIAAFLDLLQVTKAQRVFDLYKK